MKRLRSIVVAFVLLAGMSVAAPIAQAGDSNNLAGRPISGGYDANLGGGNCQGIAYGRVNGAFVLFTAHHCRYGADGVNDMDRSGMAIYGPNGQQIGTWGPLSTVSAQHDLTFIYINQSSVPVNPHQIWRGPVSGATDWWTMTAQPTSDLGCDSGTWYGDTAYQMAQGVTGYLTTVYTTRTATLGAFSVGPTGSGLTRNCTIVMNGLSTRFGSFVESGSPVIKSGSANKLFGHVTGGITVTPIYHGIQALADFYGSAKLCTDADC